MSTSDKFTYWNMAEHFRKYENGIHCHVLSDASEPRIYNYVHREFRVGQGSRQAQNAAPMEDRGVLREEPIGVPYEAGYSMRSLI